MIRHRPTALAQAVIAVPFLALAGCSSASTPSTSPPVDSGTTDLGVADVGLVDTGASDGSAEGGTATLTPAPAAPDPGKGLWLTASGESLAVTGYGFPPSSADDTFMIDGWILVLDRMIVTVDGVTLWDNPDTVPADQSQHGAVVAHLNGPWAIDLHKGGPLTGEGGAPEKSQPFASIKTKDDGSDFDTTIRYAFGFSTVASSSSALNVNLDAADLVDYQFMIDKGYSVLYVGHVARPSGDTFNEGSSTYDFSKLPQTLPFRLGFSTPTSYINCQNGSEFPGVPGINGEDYQRGVQFKSAASVIGQVTVHADHPFWESFAEDTPIHFDQIAAQYVGVTSPVAMVEDMVGVNPSAFKDKNGTALPLRSAVDSSLYAPPFPLGQQLNFNMLKVPFDPHGTDPSKAIRDYYDYIRYTQSTQGHLNSQGLCFISRNFPAPPGGS